MLAGATDPTARAILETAFAAGWVLSTPGADLLYIAQHRKKWRTIAEEVQEKRKVLAEGGATGGWVDLGMHPELAPFLEEDEEMPAPAELPSFEQMSRDGGFGEFYTIYRMITRRAHPNLDAARSRFRTLEIRGLSGDGDPWMARASNCTREGQCSQRRA
jgi:hypothetical protein